MNSSANWLEQWDALPARLGGHIWLSVAAIAIGALISLPLGIVASRHRRLEAFALTLTGLIQTIPSLALLALMVISFGTIGWVPALVALVLYSLLPMLRNTVVGLRGIDPAVREAAQGVGMTDREQLRLVELPLAAPTILAGVRTAAVWTVGMATIAQPVGADSLGSYIFVGLSTNNSIAILFGCVFSAALALALDGLLRGLETAVENRSRTRARMMLAGLALVLLSPLGLGLLHRSPEDRGSASAAATQAAPAGPAAPSTCVIGGKQFTEQFILTALLARQLQSAGITADVRDGMGSAILYEALRGGKIDCYVDYSGTLWSNVLHRTDSPAPAELRATLGRELFARDGIVVLGSLGFENSYGFAMRRKDAERLHVRTLADLAPHAGSLSCVTSMEFWGRPEWASTRDRYHFDFKDKRTMDGALIYSAVASGQVDLAVAFTTDGRLPANDLVLLEDPLKALPPYEALVLLSRRAAADPRLTEALAPLLMSLDSAAMREANRRVDIAGEAPAAAAGALLEAVRRNRQEAFQGFLPAPK